MLRDKAELFRRSAKFDVDTVRVTQRELGSDLVYAASVIKHRYKSLKVTTKGWSDLHVTVSTNELLAEPVQESMF